MVKQSNAKFIEYFEKKVRNTIRKYQLFSKNDKIAVAVSGGKDSTVCLYVLKKLGYDVEGITIDAAIGNYTKQNLENLKQVCEKYNIKLNVVSFRDEFGMGLCYLRSLLKSNGYEYSSCMLCGILKRYLLNQHSKKLKFDKLVTGHNLDDEAQSFTMNIFRNDFKQAKRQGPVAGMFKSSKFVSRVKPLYHIKEEEAERFSKIMKFPVNYDICPCSVGAYRRIYKNILDEFEKDHPNVKYNIVNFQNSLKTLAQNVEGESKKVGECSKCGEPASQSVCKTCTIFNQLKKAMDDSEKNKVTSSKAKKVNNVKKADNVKKIKKADKVVKVKKSDKVTKAKEAKKTK